MTLTESLVESATLSWLASLGYTSIFGPDIAPEEPAAERASFLEVLLTRRLGDALRRLNPAMPSDALEEALRKVSRSESPSLLLPLTNSDFLKVLEEVNDIRVNRFFSISGMAEKWPPYP